MSQEFVSVLLGDTRLERRLQSIVSQLEKKPSESFPSIFSEEAALEGFYRFLRNPSVRWERLLEGHFEQSCSRVASKEEVIMIHDTSLMQFHRERDTDLGLISGSRKGESREVGFPAHFSMAVSADVSPEPLGLIHLAPLRRLKLSKTRRRQRNRRTKDEQKSESSKWINAVRECRRKLGESARIVHVMDREADFYALMANLVRARERFVIRISHTTRLVDFADERSTVAQAISDREVICRREVWINQRRKARGLRTTKRNPPRRSREAALSITATSVEVMRSDCASAKTYPQKIRLNVVHVFESNPPEGEPPVDWKLYTTESVETETQILKIVDIYRSRWLIEEYFKALKTGCSFEERQLESFKTAMTALALLLPVAWQMLLLRHCGRRQEQPMSTIAINPTQQAVLIALSKGKLNDQSTPKEFLYAVGVLGGHIKNNGEPGWLVLYRGLRELYSIVRGVTLTGAAQYVINP